MSVAVHTEEKLSST